MNLHDSPDMTGLERYFPRPVDPYERVQSVLDSVPNFAALHAAVELGLLDALTGPPRTSREIADVCGTDPAATSRLFGWLHAHGYITTAGSDDSYKLTPLGHVLTAGADPSCRHAVLVTGSHYWRQATGRLPDTIRHGRPDPPEGLPVYEYLAATTDLAEQFDRFMTARSTAVGRDLAALGGWAGVRVVADLGGGLGGVLAALLHAHPHLTGVLAERPAVAERARTYLRRRRLLDRVQIIDADIFQQIPPADLYLLSSILHNHCDDACIALLSRIRAALQEGSGQVWIVEGMLPRRPSTPSPWYSTDVRMLTLFSGGQVRRVGQLRHLAELAGLSIIKRVHLPCGQTLLAAQPAGDHDAPAHDAPWNPPA